MVVSAPSPEPRRPGPFVGVRVLDLSRVLASPFASYLLGLLGADVIKIEDPGGGDAMRTRAAGHPDLRTAGLGTGFLSQNANKRSVTLDLRTSQGQALFRRLAAGADVVVENLRAGSMDDYGLGYEALRAVNPRLVYCSLTGYGQGGEKRRHPAYDPVIQAASGVMSLTGTPETAPMKAGIPAIDYGAGVMAAFGIVSALYERMRTGLGQHVDVSMFDTALVLMSSIVTDVLTLGSVPQPSGNTLGTGYGTNRTYRGSGGLLWIAASEPHQQAALWTVLERDDLPRNARFATEDLRRSNVAALTQEIEATLASRPLDEWERLLNEAGVPAMRVRSLPEALQLPHLASRSMFHTFEGLPGWQRPATVPMLPFGMSATPARIDRRPPLLGEHTSDVLKELGLSDEEIQAARAEGAI